MSNNLSTMYYDSIKIASTITDSVIVAFSGGKDSIVTLDLCRKYFSNVQAYSMYIAPNMEYLESILQYYEKLYRIDILRIPHPDMSKYLRYGSYRAPDSCVPVIGFKEIQDYVRNYFNIQWIASGERIYDSLWRRSMLKNIGSIAYNTQHIYPVAYWNKHAIMEYIERKKLFLPKSYKKLSCSIGSLQYDDIKFIKENYESDYEQLKRYYPLIDACIFQHEHFT